MKRVFGILSLGVVLAAANVTYAQEKVQQDEIKKQPRVVSVEHKERPKLTEEQKEKIKAERKANFIKELDLTEKEAEKYFSIQSDYMSKFQKLHQEQRSLREALKTAEQLSDKDLKKDLERLNAIDVELAKLKADKFDKEVSAIGIRKVTKAHELGRQHGPKGPKHGPAKKGVHPKAKSLDNERVQPFKKVDGTKVPRPTEK